MNVKCIRPRPPKEILCRLFGQMPLPVSGEPQYALYLRELCTILNLVGGSLSLLILMVIAGLACHPISRPLLDRVSFRIMVYALLANLVYCTGLGLNDNLELESICWTMRWLLNLCLLMSSFLFFCIGLNLMLVMVHGVRGQKIEKYYVGGSILLAIIVSIPAFATLKKYGCGNANRTIGWQIATRHFWNILTIIGEMATFLSIFMHMLKLKVFEGTGRTSPPSYDAFSSILAAYRRPMGPKQYRNTVLRIGIYPLISLVTLTVATVSAIYVNIIGGFTVSKKAYAVFIMGSVAYRIRPLAYALGAATDPSLHRALRALYRYFRSRRRDSQIRPGTRSRLDRNTIDPPISKPERTFPNTHSRFTGLPVIEELESGTDRSWGLHDSQEVSDIDGDFVLFKQI